MVTTDEVYKMLLIDAYVGEKYTTRGHACRRVRHVDIAFTSTPLVCMRRTAWQSALQEFAWFLSGSTRVDDLPPSVRSWWSPWPDGTGYGRFTDELARGEFSIWDPSGALPPCAYTAFTAQTYRGSLQLSMMQRSCDLVCGAPHDWFQLWAYGLWLAAQRGVPLASVRWLCVDAHVYEAHSPVIEAIVEQRPQVSPELYYDASAREFRPSDFSLLKPYNPALTMRAELIV